MPYDQLSDLPSAVKNSLPKHAQEIYRAAFNNAWEEYARAKDRYEDDTRDETAHKVAWSAVKQKYHKSGNEWVANE